MVFIIAELRYKIRKIMHCECCVTCHYTVDNISIWLPGQCPTPMKIVKHKRGKPLKVAKKKQ